MGRATVGFEIVVPSEARAIELCRAGLTPRELDRHLSGAGIDYVAKKWRMDSTSEAIGLAVYYGLMTEKQASAKYLEVYGADI